MTTLSPTEARRRFYTLLDDVERLHTPISIVGKRGSAVLIAEADWRAVEETLYLLAIPGMRVSIVKGLKTPLKKCHKELDW